MRGTYGIHRSFVISFIRRFTYVSEKSDNFVKRLAAWYGDLGEATQVQVISTSTYGQRRPKFLQIEGSVIPMTTKPSNNPLQLLVSTLSSAHSANTKSPICVTVGWFQTQLPLGVFAGL